MNRYLIILFILSNLLLLVYVGSMKYHASESESSKEDANIEQRYLADWIPKQTEGVQLIAIFSDYSCMETLEFNVPKVSELQSSFPELVNVIHFGEGNTTSKLVDPQIKLEEYPFPEIMDPPIANPLMLLVDDNNLIHYSYNSHPQNQSEGEAFFEQVESLFESL